MERKRQDAPGDLELVRAFINTLDLEEGADELSSGAALAHWVSARELAPSGIRAGRRELEDALELREALRQSLLANTAGRPTPPEAARTIERAAQRAKLAPRFAVDTSPLLEPRAGGVDGALGRLLAVVHQAVADGTWTQLKACRDESCQWAFYDHTKNHSGSWCTMQVCGNRAKARAFRERQKAAAQSPGVGSGAGRPSG